MLELLSQPWPWYVAGPLIGLMVPTLLLVGNKALGISSSLRHICASCLPAGIDFFNYNWKAQSWNLFFVAGIFLGGVVASVFLGGTDSIRLSPELVKELAPYGIAVPSTMVPQELFSWEALLTLRGFLLLVVGGLLVGFGTRWAGGCTSGHSIMGLSNLQWPSLVATLCFMIGGFVMTHLILPFILSL